MRSIRITSLPVILFAHKFKAEEYHGAIKKHINSKIEITVVTEGTLAIEQNGENHVLERGDVICNLFESKLTVDAKDPHSHHTVCFGVDFELTDINEKNALVLPLVTHPAQSSTLLLHLIDEIIKSHTTNSENHMKHSGLFLQLLGELDNINRQSENNYSPYEFH